MLYSKLSYPNDHEGKDESYQYANNTCKHNPCRIPCFAAMVSQSHALLLHGDHVLLDFLVRLVEDRLVFDKRLGEMHRILLELPGHARKLVREVGVQGVGVQE